MPFDPTNAGQPFAAQKDVQEVKDSLSGSGTIPIRSIAGTSSAPGLGVFDVTTGFYRSSLNRLDMVMGAGVVPGRWSPTGLRLGTPADAQSWLEVVSPYSGWGGSVISQPIDGLRVDVGGLGLGSEVPLQGSTPNIVAVAGAIKIPTPAPAIPTNGQGCGLAGFARTAGARNGVGVYGSAALTASGGDHSAWGGNFVLEDGNFTTSQIMFGIEVDLNIDNAANLVRGVDVVGNGAAVAVTNSIGVSIRELSVGQHAKWATGVDIGPGSSDRGVKLNPQALSANNSKSIPISFVTRTSGGVVREGLVFANENGDLILRSGAGASSSTQLLIQAPLADPTAAGTTWASFEDGTVGGELTVNRVKIPGGGAGTTGFLQANSTNGTQLYGCQGSANDLLLLNRSGAAAMSITANTVNVGFAGNVGITGSLSKGSGSFDIPHPDPSKPEGTRLRHCFVESPTAGDNLYRYRVQLDRYGGGRIPLPDYFRHLNEDPQAWCTHGADAVVDPNMLSVHVTGVPYTTVGVLIIATRKDPTAVEHWMGLGLEYVRENASCVE